MCRWVNVFQKQVKCFAVNCRKITFKSVKSLEKRYTNNLVCQNAECSHFTNDCRQNYCRISHSLNVAYIWPVQIKQLQNLLNLINKFIFVFHLLTLSGKRPVEILSNLGPDAFFNPAFLTSLQKLHVKLPCNSKLIFKNHWPYCASQFVWDSFF